jgi:chromosome segregation ATPase
MRDIRDDLRERANMLEEQINSAQTQFEKYLEQLRTDQENRVKDLKAELEAVKALLTIELRRHGAAPVVAAVQAQPPARKSQQPLADYLVRKLAELGPMSKDAIQRLALQEGYFADGDADRGVQAVLMHVVKGGSVRQLPNGDFAEVIRLRRAM